MSCYVYVTQTPDVGREYQVALHHTCHYLEMDINKITMETKLIDGKIDLKGNLVVREKPKKPIM